MFSSLTTYLLQYKKVAIPHVGQFELVTKPASLDVADRLIYGLSYHIHYQPQFTVDDHQLQYLSVISGSDNSYTEQQLDDFGKQWQQHIQQYGFDWNNIGRLEWTEQNNITFSSTPINIPACQPIPARRVLREHVQHKVLVGEQEVQSKGQYTEYAEPQPKSRRSTIWIASIIAVLATAFIVYYFSTHGLSPLTSGYHQKIKVAAPAATYQ